VFCSLYSCIEGSAPWCLGVNSFVLWAELVWFTVNCTEMVSAPTLGIGGSQNGRLVGDDVLSLVLCMCISSSTCGHGCGYEDDHWDRYLFHHSVHFFQIAKMLDNGM